MREREEKKGKSRQLRDKKARNVEGNSAYTLGNEKARGEGGKRPRDKKKDEERERNRWKSVSRLEIEIS